MDNDKIKQAMLSTWDAIGSDVLSIAPSYSAPKEIVIEMVLDGDRLITFGNLSNEEFNEFHKLTFEEKIAIGESAFIYDEYS